MPDLVTQDLYCYPEAPKVSSVERDHSIFSLEIFAGRELPNTFMDQYIISIKRQWNTSLGVS